jgi:3',5'-cyclic AMP phosphodiesterase CpdA
MRILHMTDVHFYRPVTGVRAALGKRGLGLANLHLRGRVHHFDADALVATAVADATEQQADLFVMTGDLSALAQDSEFAAARAAFGPLLESMPSIVVPGNHDRYTVGAMRSFRMERHFGAWMRGGDWGEAGWDGPPIAAGSRAPLPGVFRLGDVAVVATDPCRPGLSADGLFGTEQIAGIEAAIRQARDQGRQVVLLTHYPMVWGDGTPYRRRGHCVADLDAVLAALDRQPPDLVLHGHNHQYWRTEVQLGGRAVPVVNCGTSSAVSPLEPKTAGYCIHDLRGRELVSVQRRVRVDGEAGWRDAA